MKAFKFNLASVQLLRRQREQAALEEYARALAGQSRARESLRHSEHSLADCQNRRRQAVARGCPAAELAQWTVLAQWLEQARQLHARKLAETRRHTERKLHEMLAARQALETVNQIEARRFGEYRKAAALEEQKFLDELALRVACASPSAHPSHRPSAL